MIEKFQKDFPVPLLHIWHEDDGFYLAKMRNKCIAKAQYGYMIQIDGDMILNSHFVADHILFASPGYYLKGGRVNIMKSKTEYMCKKKSYRYLGFFSSGLKRRENAIHCLRLARYLAPRRKTRPGLGCNMSYWRDDALKINGYDEFFVGWGGEDYDFCIRLLNIGCKKLSLKFAAIGFHLWHKGKFMDNKDKNFSYYHEKVAEKAVWCKHGVDQYLEKRILSQS